MGRDPAIDSIVENAMKYCCPTPMLFSLLYQTEAKIYRIKSLQLNGLTVL
jgi:hypothetical protein